MAKLTFGGFPNVSNDPFHGLNDLAYANEAWNKQDTAQFFMPGGFDMGTSFNPTVNTAQVDGGARFTDFLRGMTGAVLNNMGAQAEPQIYQASAGGGSASGLLSPGVIMAAAAVGVGIYLVSKS